MTTLIFLSLIFLSAGLVTSISVLSGFHIFMAIPSLYFITKTNFKNFSKSAYALLAFLIIVMLSVLINQDVAIAGYKPITKVKYFLYGFFAIAPMTYFFKNFYNEKKLKILIYLFMGATTFATIVGLISLKTGYNFISQRTLIEDRNAGLMGMILNYAHNLAFFQIIILGMVIYREELKKYLNLNILYSVFIINFIGLYFTYTRGAILAFLVGAPFYLFKKYKSKFIISTIVLVFLAIGLAFISGNNIIRPGSDSKRLSLWKTAVIAFKERPLTGYGYLNFERHSLDIKRRYNVGDPEFGGHAHNNFLEVLASTGIFGFLAFTSWVVLWLWEMYRREDLVARIALPFIVVFIVGGLTQATISLGINLFFIMAAYSISQINRFEVIKEQA